MFCLKRQLTFCSYLWKRFLLSSWIKQYPQDRTLYLPFFFHYKHITSLKNLPLPTPDESWPYWFQGNFVAVFVLNYLLREFLLSAFANCFGLRCEMKQLMLFNTNMPLFLLLLWHTNDGALCRIESCPSCCSDCKARGSHCCGITALCNPSISEDVNKILAKVVMWLRCARETLVCSDKLCKNNVHIKLQDPDSNLKQKSQKEVKI